MISSSLSLVVKNMCLWLVSGLYDRVDIDIPRLKRQEQIGQPGINFILPDTIKDPRRPYYSDIAAFLQRGSFHRSCQVSITKGHDQRDV